LLYRRRRLLASSAEVLVSQLGDNRGGMPLAPRWFVPWGNSVSSSCLLSTLTF